jgi:putative photosynthetic complex assembly protein
MSASATPTSETKPFIVIFAGLAVVILLIGSARLAGYRPSPSIPAEPALAMRELSVEDSTEGSVIVRDAKTGETIASYKRGEGSFFRATLRTLVHDRLHKGFSLKGNFRLENHSGNRLFLIDEVSGKTLAMNAFGPTNTAVFAALMFNPNQGESQ